MSSTMSAVADEEVEEGKGVLAILDKSGDLKIIWDKENEDEVELARKHFNEAKKKGFTAYSVTKKGDKDEVIKDFDPDAEKIIMCPRLVGG